MNGFYIKLGNKIFYKTYGESVSIDESTGIISFKGDIKLEKSFLNIPLQDNFKDIPYTVLKEKGDLQIIKLNNKTIYLYNSIEKIDGFKELGYFLQVVLRDRSIFLNNLKEKYNNFIYNKKIYKLKELQEKMTFSSKADLLNVFDSEIFLNQNYRDKSFLEGIKNIIFIENGNYYGSFLFGYLYGYIDIGGYYYGIQLDDDFNYKTYGNMYKKVEVLIERKSKQKVMLLDDKINKNILIKKEDYLLSENIKEKLFYILNK